MTNHCIWGYPIFRRKWMDFYIPGAHPLKGSVGMPRPGNPIRKCHGNLPKNTAWWFQIWSMFNIVEPDLG